MKRAIKLILWASMVVTIIIIVLTILSMYSIHYIKFFQNYHPFQVSLFFTLIIWSLEIIINKKGKNYIFYGITFIVLANLIFLFMLWGVK
ncbi:putative membrane protein [Clostridium punense]|uniref:Membrane protein n=1 Tax=Clostridium punense TaxID=1054297 RepID=A0ABS4K364_9CLOT|nr:hypothetical protein [Clostridium punense]EQB90023.1 hypothetical protein M918_01965 [Clostridium sp. BL8]MBP2022224.1 putative membrane protein [Clostridium punense]